ncbi:hypothetical protein CDD81_2119 [Ophiocordyceps australis]|uniref:Uncharacterized protein n=1 Tax=Ophiocordyceps australis TaxID=1399860 RepID=A0A2C5XUJ1_9HYPO|nr:hypothetical protein CDD81_2119 [Ophiocordyceps australis]
MSHPHDQDNPPDSTPSPQSPSTPSNPKISIPKIPPLSSLKDCHVDQFANIVTSKGIHLGRAQGDLPAMVGQPVSKNGEILDSEGNPVGFVSEVYDRPPLDSALRVDSVGNIYDQHGAIVGKMHTNHHDPNNVKDAQDSQNPQDSQQKEPNHSKPKPTNLATPSPSEIYLDVKSTHDGIQLIIKIPTVFSRDS